VALIVANETTDGNGVVSWDATSVYNGPSPSTLRVKAPDDPAPGKPHRFLYVLPVKPDLSVEFGDGLEELRTLGAHDDYNCTLIAITTPTEPWIGDNPSNADHRYESFLVLDVVPWVEANLASSGEEEHWLLSFSKGGYSALSLFFRHRDIFAQVAAWDTPYHQAWNTAEGFEMDESYGTEGAWEADYKLDDNLAGWAVDDILHTARLWVSGDDSVYEADTADLTADLLTLGVRHYWATGTERAHAWDSGWLAGAIAAMDAAYQGRTQDPGTLPPVGTALNTAHPLSEDLEVLLLFYKAQGSHLWNLGLAEMAPGLLSSSQTYADGPDGPILEQNAGDGADFGAAYLGLDESDKTLCFWLRPDVLDAFQGLFGKDFDSGGGTDGGWVAMLTDQGRMLWHADADKDLIDDGAAELVAEAWVFVAIAWDLSAKEASFYVNGALNSVQDDATITEASSGAAELILGKIRDNTLHAYTGAFFQVRAYSRTLSAVDISQLAANPMAGLVQAPGALQAVFRRKRGR
jgi:esterase/lipase superfamily enzyme